MDFDQLACTIIANAGDGKSDAFAAIDAAKEGDFATASAYLKSSSEKLLKAHEAHSQILFAEANGELKTMKFILVHASNHLSMGELAHDFAQIVVDLYQEDKKG